jgi:hypothetical protein
MLMRVVSGTTCAREKMQLVVKNKHIKPNLIIDC